MHCSHAGVPEIIAYTWTTDLLHRLVSSFMYGVNPRPVSHYLFKLTSQGGLHL